jgi:phospholipid/cholesterol/gamma-HCH transport system ATP-binding protein
MKQDNIIQVENLTLGYDNFVLMDNLNFNIKKGDIFVIMGGSGCGKSTLLRTMTGLIPALKGKIIIKGIDMIQANEKTKNHIMRQCGILYQSGALFSSMTLSENIALPLQLYTDYSDKTIHDIISFKLSLVGLSGFEDFYPHEISGGMKKRAGLARALALDPDIVYFDEPSAGLDPISSKNLDNLICDINQSLGTTIVLVTHELPSLLSIGTNGIFLDALSKSITAYGKPLDLLKNPPNKEIYNFLTRGE